MPIYVSTNAPDGYIVVSPNTWQRLIPLPSVVHTTETTADLCAVQKRIGTCPLCGPNPLFPKANLVKDLGSEV